MGGFSLFYQGPGTLIVNNYTLILFQVFDLRRQGRYPALAHLREAGVLVRQRVRLLQQVWNHHSLVRLISLYRRTLITGPSANAHKCHKFCLNLLNFGTCGVLQR